MVHDLVALLLRQQFVEVKEGHQLFGSVFVSPHLRIGRIKKADLLVELAMLPDAMLVDLSLALLGVLPAGE